MQRRRGRLRKRHLKSAGIRATSNFVALYSISFNSSNFDKFLWSCILKDRIKVQEKKRKVVVCFPVLDKNVKLGTFTL